MKNYVQPGDVLTFTATADTAGGVGVLLGKLFGVNAYTVKTGETGEFQVVGVFDLPKTSAEAWTVGADVYWDNAAKVVTTTSASNTLVGKAVLAADNPSGIGRVRLNG